MSAAHASFSPSGSEKRYLCPASFALEEGLPDSTNEYSEEGTDAHELAAACLRTGNQASFYLGKRMENGWEVDDDMVEHVQKYVDAVLNYADGHTLFVEQRVHYGPFVDEDDAWGTGDAIIVTADGEELQAHDLKFGRGVKVDSSYPVYSTDEDGNEVEIARRGNRQLMCYALGALNEYGMLGDFKRVRLVIHQPRLDHLSEWDCTVDELMAFAEEEKHAILQCKNARTIQRSNGLEPTSSYFNPSATACRWCKAAPNCPALSAYLSREMFDEIDVIEDVGTIPDAPQAPSDARKLGHKMDLIPLFEHYVKAVRAEGERQLFAGNPPIGKDGAYKLVRGKKGARAWEDTTQAEAELKAMRLKKDEMYDYSIKSPTQIEKQLKESPRKWKKLLPLIKQSEGGISVAPATDKRPAHDPTPSDDEFDDLTGENDVSSEAA